MSVIKDTVSGLIGGIAVTYSGLPLDVLKTRQQTTFKHTSLFQTAVLTARGEGILAFWKGAGPALSSALIENAVVFTANGALTRVALNYKQGELSLSEEAAIGGLSGFFSATSICPSEVVKVRMQTSVNESHPVTFLSTVKQVYAEAGVRGFFNGLPAIIARDIPFYVAFFGAYRTYFYAINHFSSTPSNRDDVNPLHFILGGGFAGMAGWSLVFPLDVIKSRQQRTSSHLSFRSVLIDLHRVGLKKAMRGWTAAVARGFPANGALFLAVEISNKLLEGVDM
jgi:solute carrier family 25 (mitochondrial ornithine transporter) member 2/15